MYYLRHVVTEHGERIQLKRQLCMLQDVIKLSFLKVRNLTHKKKFIDHQASTNLKCEVLSMRKDAIMSYLLAA